MRTVATFIGLMLWTALFTWAALSATQFVQQGLIYTAAFYFIIMAALIIACFLFLKKVLS